MSVSGYLFDQFDDDELAIILAIHNNLSDNTRVSIDVLKCMKYSYFISKINQAKERANKEGRIKINQILNKINSYTKQ